MIAVRLMGGLGNQIFQYAVGRSLAAARDTELVLDLGWFSAEGGRASSPRQYELGAFDLPARTIRVSPLRIKLLERRATRRLSRLTWASPGLTLVREKGANFDPAISQTPDDSLLIGFWQSEQYFHDTAKTLRGELTCRRPFDAPGTEVARKIAASKSLGIHVRRGDYVTNPATNEFHGALDREYYEHAVAFVLDRAPIQQVFVFSDDPDWAREALSFSLPTTHVSREGRDHVDDLRLLQMCDHQVIANSSFSWWAAWLNDNPEKIVVAPRQWFRDSSIDTTDLIPPSWYRL